MIEPLLLIVDGGSERRGALIRREGGARLLGALSQPSGGAAEALEATLMSAAGLTGTPMRVVATEGDLPRAAGRLAAWIGGPVRIAEITPDGGRITLASPDRAAVSLDVPGAATVPADPVERRRRCDGVLALLGRTDRSLVADLLGDLADAPLRDRDDARDQVRAAAVADAMRRLADLMADEDLSELDLEGAPLLLVGVAASLIATGTLPITVAAPLVPPGRTPILLEPYGIFSALGGEALDDSWVDSALPSLARDLLLPGGDLVRIGGEEGDELLVRTSRGEVAISHGEIYPLPLRTGEKEEVLLTREGQQAEFTMHGGIARAAVVFGDVLAPLHEVRSGSLSAAITAAASAAPIPAPISLLPPGAATHGVRDGRLLLGDLVEGEVHFSESEPEGSGWERAVAAGLLAIGSASPETVLRARAVGVRGVIVHGLSDGERDALNASLERRIAAAVATAPFGLMIMTPRRPTPGGDERMMQLLRGLHGARVRFSDEPIGIIVHGGGADRQAGDVRVIGGIHEGRTGVWEGLADPRADDPLGAVRLDGKLCAVPLGDLQRFA
ncbi:MAG: SIMPL domain-containing protein [Candidatus Limnocylindrus sp.]